MKRHAFLDLETLGTGPAPALVEIGLVIFAVKQLFWDAEDCVVQFHPPRSEYVNIHPVLHLWRWTGGAFPRPPKVLV